MSQRTDQLNELRRCVRSHHQDGYATAYVVMNPADSTELFAGEDVMVVGRTHNWVHIIEHDHQTKGEFVCFDEEDWSCYESSIKICIAGVRIKGDHIEMDAEKLKRLHDRLAQSEEFKGRPPGCPS